MTAPHFPYITTATSFLSDGETCAGTLYLPNRPGPHPVVVMAHGFGGTQEARLPAFADRFCREGLAVLVFDYRHFGKSGGWPRQVLDIGKQLGDWHAAIAFARSLNQVDGRRVAIWGTSFSGGHVLSVAAELPYLKAVVAQVPFTDGLAQMGKPLQALRLSAVGLLDMGRSLLGMKPKTIGVVGAPGTLAAMTTPDAEPGYRRLVEGLVDWHNEVAARIVLALPLYRPITGVTKIKSPVLYVIAQDDVVTPTKPAYAAAKRTLNAEVVTLPGGHFDPYVAPVFESAIAPQIAFLKKHLI